MERLLSTKAKVLVLFRRDGSMPSFLACSRTAFWISGATRALPRITREAVATLTFAPDAISRSPALPFLESSFFISNEPSNQEIDLDRIQPSSADDHPARWGKPGEERTTNKHQQYRKLSRFTRKSVMACKRLF